MPPKQPSWYQLWAMGLSYKENNLGTTENLDLLRCGIPCILRLSSSHKCCHTTCQFQLTCWIYPSSHLETWFSRRWPEVIQYATGEQTSMLPGKRQPLWVKERRNCAKPGHQEIPLGTTQVAPYHAKMMCKNIPNIMIGRIKSSLFNKIIHPKMFWEPISFGSNGF